MDYKAEEIKPYNAETDKTTQVREMFDSIAPAYDAMNRTMTVGIDRWWRRVAVKMLRRYPHRHILDVATGTGDLALLLDERLSPDQIIGVDLSEGMLRIAREKAVKRNAQRRILFEVQDCLSMDFDDNSFDVVTVAYGVRNFEHLEAGFREMYRVLRPGGALCVIELSTPERFPFRQLYKFYTYTFIPFIGRLVSKDRSAYSYLPRSVAAVPQGEAMLDIFRRAGFDRCYCRRLTFGACTIYIGEKKKG